MAVPHVMDRLIDACQAVGSPACAGLDLHLDLLPPGLPGSSPLEASRTFLFEVLEALVGAVAVVKPQIAFFEQLGADGMRLYFDTVRESHRRGFLVIGDVKRSDIGSTAAAYARAHLGPEDGSAADLVTVNPYLGRDGVQPFLDLGRRRGRGVFVLVRTSNRSARELQGVPQDPEPLYRRAGKLLEEWGADHLGRRGFHDVGAVVGATRPDECAELRRLLPHTFFLVPGYGAQGGTAGDVAGAFREDRTGAVVSSSRGILFAYRDRPELSYARAAREAALTMKQQIASALSGESGATVS